MTVTIKYNSQLAESTISSYMKDWTEKRQYYYCHRQGVWSIR